MASMVGSSGATAGSEGVADVDRAAIDAVLFDLDGVVTDTAEAHFESWKRLFDSYLEQAAPGEAPFRHEDYLRYVDGKPRYEGVRSFLESRGIRLPFGTPEDAPGTTTVCCLGNRKNGLFGERVRNGGVSVFEGSLAWIDQLRAQGFRLALVTSSRNASLVMAAAGIEDLFEVVIDGTVAADLGLTGKPEPDTFLEAARRLDTPAGRSAVVEDAEAGVAAGRRGGFGLVIGVARVGNADALRAAGADVVVDDLRRLCARGGGMDAGASPCVAGGRAVRGATGGKREPAP